LNSPWIFEIQYSTASRSVVDRSVKPTLLGGVSGRQLNCGAIRDSLDSLHPTAYAVRLTFHPIQNVRAAKNQTKATSQHRCRTLMQRGVAWESA
jgi:hypothetical protein